MKDTKLYEILDLTPEANENEIKKVKKNFFHKREIQ